MMRILLIEDEEAARAGLVAELTSRGYDVDISDTATTALDEMKARAYDLLLLDIMIPGGEGFIGVPYREMGKELLRRVRAETSGSYATSRQVPAVAVTAVSDLNLYAALRSLGVLYVLQKPVDPEGVADQVDEICKSLRRDGTDE